MVERYFAVTAGDERTDGLALISDFGTATNPTPSSLCLLYTSDAADE